MIIQKYKKLQKLKENHNHPQDMTLVFGALPPVAIVLALPLLLPSVPNQKGVLANIYILMFMIIILFIRTYITNTIRRIRRRKKKEEVNLKSSKLS